MSDMEKPMLHVLEDCRPFFHGGIVEWKDNIERYYAPGCLEMYGAGYDTAPDHDHSRFINGRELEGISREGSDNTRVFIEPEHSSSEDDLSSE